MIYNREKLAIFVKSWHATLYLYYNMLTAYILHLGGSGYSATVSLATVGKSLLISGNMLSLNYNFYKLSLHAAVKPVLAL